MLEELEKKAKEYNFVKRVYAIETLFIFIIDFSKEKCQKRDVAINILRVLYRKSRLSMQKELFYNQV